MTLSETLSYHVVTDAAVPVAIPCPSSCKLHKIRVVKSTGDFTVTFYNRSFTGSAVDINRIISDGGTHTRVAFEANHNLRVGEQFTVASNTVAGYNAVHVVTSVVNATEVVTNQTYSADGKGGTGTLSIQAANYPLFEVTELLTSVSSVVRLDFESLSNPPIMVNQDPEGSVGKPKYMYALFSVTGTYWVTLGIEAD